MPRVGPPSSEDIVRRSTRLRREGAPGAVGIAQVVTLSRILAGAYWPDLQPHHTPRIAVADAHSGIATVNVVHVLERID